MEGYASLTRNWSHRRKVSLRRAASAPIAVRYADGRTATYPKSLAEIRQRIDSTRHIATVKRNG